MAAHINLRKVQRKSGDATLVLICILNENALESRQNLIRINMQLMIILILQPLFVDFELRRRG